MSETRKTPREAALAKPKSSLLAIAAFCYDCMGGANSENPSITKAAVRDCKAADCPLHLHRGWRKITTRTRSNKTPNV
ncbi:MAG: hypothetical protein Q8O79_00860 [Pseudomonadota bacterium]|nr:hypothetical protein [Pseudomonadota bacterium]